MKSNGSVSYQVLSNVSTVARLRLKYHEIVGGQEPITPEASHFILIARRAQTNNQILRDEPKECPHRRLLT